MKLSSRSWVSGISVIALALILLTTFVALSTSARTSALAQAKDGQKTKGDHHLRKGPVTLVKKNSQPLHRPVNPPAPPLLQNQDMSLNSGKTQHVGSMQSNLSSCSQPTIDLKVLVIAADGKEADLPAIQQTLDYLGTPYTVYQAAQTPGGLTPDLLANGCHGFYQGIILTDGELVYYNGSTY